MYIWKEVSADNAAFFSRWQQNVYASSLFILRTQKIAFFNTASIMGFNYVDT